MFADHNLLSPPIGDLAVVVSKTLFMFWSWKKKEHDVVCAIGEDTAGSSYCVEPTYNIVDKCLTWSTREMLIDEERVPCTIGSLDLTPVDVFRRFLPSHWD